MNYDQLVYRIRHHRLFAVLMLACVCVCWLLLAKRPFPFIFVLSLFVQFSFASFSWCRFPLFCNYSAPKTLSAWPIFILEHFETLEHKKRHWNAQDQHLEVGTEENWKFKSKEHEPKTIFGSFTHWPTVAVELKWRNQNITAKRIDKQFHTVSKRSDSVSVCERQPSHLAFTVIVPNMCGRVSFCLVCLMYDGIWMKRTGSWLGLGVRFQSVYCEYVWYRMRHKNIASIDFN